MNRRDLLKQTGAALLATSPLSAMTSPSYDPQPKTSCQDRPLVITFLGPFCFWVNNNATSHEIIAMAAPVGLTFIVPHQPWMATTANEAQIPGQDSPSYQLSGVLGIETVNYIGTPVFKYGQESQACTSTLPPQNGSCVPPLFRLSMPLPDQIIGLNPTCVEMGPPSNANVVPQSVASAVSFVYRKVTSPVQVTSPDGFKYIPDFSNDKTLPMMSLGVHVTPQVRPDPGHEHAKLVLNQMFAMCPWISLDDIRLCPLPKAKADRSGADDTLLLVGSGNDCSVPTMMLDGDPPSSHKYKPRGVKK